jgi:hypothetical protein
MVGEIRFHFKRLGLSGATLVVVAVGTEVYSACAFEPLTALHEAAFSASEDLAKRCRPVDPNVIIAQGKDAWRRTNSVDGTERSSPATLPREAA